LEKIVAILHDTIEDTNLTLHLLKGCGFDYGSILEDVGLLTESATYTYQEYLHRISESKTAIKVKLADLEDNLNILELQTISNEKLKRMTKYWSAHRFLKAYLDA